MPVTLLSEFLKGIGINTAYNLAKKGYEKRVN